jgi:ankyrin repeat protein
MKLGRRWIPFILLALFGTLASAQSQEQADRMARAVQFDDLAQVKKLLQDGVSPNLLVRGGNPLTVYAVRENSKQTLNYLLSLKNLDVDQPNLSGETVLMMASLYGLLPEVKVLVDKRAADINKTGWTPLHYACTNGHLEIAEFLLNKGAEVNAVSNSDTTPLMMAIRSGNIQLVRLLLDRGADLQIRNHQGFSAIDVADLFNQVEISRGLRSRWEKLYKTKYEGGPKPVTVESSPKG